MRYCRLFALFDLLQKRDGIEVFPLMSLQFMVRQPNWPHRTQSRELSEQQRAHSSPTDSDYRLCSIACLINSTFEKLLYYDVFDSQGLMINLQRLLLALAKHRWYELWGQSCVRESCKTSQWPHEQMLARLFSDINPYTAPTEINL